MAKLNKNNKGHSIRIVKASNQAIRSFEAKNLFSFLDGFSKSSQKYNSLDIKVDSNLIKQKINLSNS